MRWPIVGAPMAGGPSTPALAAAVTEAGGLGFLAGGYLTAGALEEQVRACRALTSSPFGVNLFVPQDPGVDEDALAAYIDSLRPEADAYGVALVPSWDDDGWPEKLELLSRDPVAVVSFTFGCPTPEIVHRLQRVGSRVVVTVTTPTEAALAAAAGADAVSAQGIEAGGHQGTFDDDRGPDTGWGLLALVTAIRHQGPVPVIAAGGLMTGDDVAAVLRAGAVAAQLGTALVRSDESGASAVHKAALADPSFSGTALDTRLQWPTSPRSRQPIHAGAPRRPVGLPLYQQRHPGVAAPGGIPERPRRNQSVGRPGIPVGRSPAGGRHPHAYRIGARGPEGGVPNVRPS